MSFKAILPLKGSRLWAFRPFAKGRFKCLLISGHASMSSSEAAGSAHPGLRLVKPCGASLTGSQVGVCSPKRNFRSHFWSFGPLLNAVRCVCVFQKTMYLLCFFRMEGWGGGTGGRCGVDAGVEGDPQRPPPHLPLFYTLFALLISSPPLLRFHIISWRTIILWYTPTFPCCFIIHILLSHVRPINLGLQCRSSPAPRPSC